MKQKMEKSMYIFCFFMLNIVDFLRHTYHGHISDVAVNLTGFLMFLIIMSGLKIRKERKKIHIIWTIVFSAIICFWGMWFIQEPRSMWIYTPLTMYLNLYWLVFYLITVLDKEFKKRIKDRVRGVGILLIIFTILALISRSKDIWPLWYLIMFGCFYCVDYSREKIKNLCAGVIDGTILSFFVLQIYAYGFRPWDQVRYEGAYANCAMAALHYLVVFCMVLIKLHILRTEKAPYWKQGLFLMGAAGLWGFQFVTLSRTALIASGLIMVCYCFIVVKRLWKAKFQGILLWIISMGACIVLVLPLVFLTIRYLPGILHHPIWYAGEYNVNKIHSFDPIDSEKYTSISEFIDVAIGRLQPTENRERLEEEFTDVLDKNTVGSFESILTNIFGARGKIYCLYLQHLNWGGHDSDYTREWPGSAQWHAHDLYLQIFFSYGTLAGIVFIIMMIILFIRSYKNIIHNEEDPYAILPFFLMIAILSFGLTDIMWLLGQFPLFLLYFIQHPQINQGVQHEEQKDICTN